MRVFHNSFSPVGEPSWSRCNLPGEIAGDRPPRYEKKNATLTVERGPVPRQRPRTPTLAGDRPPRYEKKRHPHRRARACPSPAFSRRILPVCDQAITNYRQETHIVAMEIAGDRPPRYEKKNAPLTVARGPVPRNAVRDEHSRGTGPRATKKKTPPSP